MFSATFDKTVEAIIRDLLTDPIRISVGTVGEANEDVTQVVHVLKEESEKWPWMVQNLPFFAKNGSVIVFVSTKNAVELLSQNLSKFGFPGSPAHLLFCRVSPRRNPRFSSKSNSFGSSRR